MSLLNLAFGNSSITQKARARPRRTLAALAVLFFSTQFILAERLPVKQYTIADGLAQGTVRSIHQDAHGFLWLATSDGLSRFDGYRFTNYGVKDGLGRSYTYDVVSDRRGRLWIATSEGVSLLLDEAEAARTGKKFRNFLIGRGDRASAINKAQRILFDGDNRLWCVTDTGLYRAKSLEVADEQFELIAPLDSIATVSLLLLDRRGRIWASSLDRLVCVEGGRVVSYQLWREGGEHPGDPDYRWIGDGLELGDGRIILATGKDLYEFIEPAAAGQRGGWRRLPLTLAPLQSIGNLHPAPGGGFWIGTQYGLIRYRNGQEVTYKIGNSPNPFHINAFLTDRDGNLWIGTRHTGLLKLAGEAIVVYDAGDGLLPVIGVYWLFETNDHRMILSGQPISRRSCNETFLTTDTASRTGSLNHLRPPPGLCVHHIVQDGRKNWWVLRWLPEQEIYKVRFIPGPKLDLSAGYELTAADGWVDGQYLGIYLNSENQIWFRKAGQVFRVEYTRSGRPRIREIVRTEYPLYLLEDPYGAFWMSNGSSLLRHRNEKTETIQLNDDGQPKSIRGFFTDSKGRLWVNTLLQGVFMTENPNADHPHFVQYNTANGLSTNYVESVIEDNDGRIWFGTMRGIEILDPASGRVSRFTFSDNSLGSVVPALHRDRRGYLWASVLGAVIRIDSRLLPRPSSQLPVSFGQIRIAGELLPLAETGASKIATPELPATRNNIAIEFLSPDFRGENALRYQYKLEDIDRDWSAPSLQREVNYANLSPGVYRFLARAVSNDGVMSAEPASLSFTILRPVWQRWWFLTLSAIALGLAIYGAYRYRLAQVVEMERVRLRIASDLHDDVGANLSLIAGVSEMLKEQSAQTAPLLSGQLTMIAEASRRSMDALSDIVWMINPGKDHLVDLTQRMRRFAGETLTPRNVELRFSAPEIEEDLALSDELRREMFLIFKEAINNSARHAGCSLVEVSLRLDGATFCLSIKDDGKGFDSAQTNGGNGLQSMRRRARQLGGELMLSSTPGLGTEIEVQAPGNRPK